MPQEPENQSESTNPRQGNGPTSNPDKSSSTPSQNIYRHIIDCPLREFIKFTVDDNLYALVISGKPTEDELSEAGANLVMEFDDRMGDGESKMYLELLKEVTLLNCDYEMIQSIILPMLSRVHLQYMADELNAIIKYDPPFAFDPEYPVQYRKDLKRCDTRSKSILIQYQLKKAELDQMIDKNKGHEKATKEHYYSILSALSRHNKFHVTDHITVFDYCEFVKEYNAYYKAQVQSNAKH